jgi:hypothetical protein
MLSLENLGGHLAVCLEHFLLYANLFTVSGVSGEGEI